MASLIRFGGTLFTTWAFNLSIVVAHIQIRLRDLEMPSVVLQLTHLTPTGSIFEL